MPCSCDIVINNSNLTNNGVLYSGQELSGTAVVVTEKPRFIKGIHIIIRGIAKVKWQRGQFKIFEEERQLLGTQTYLWGDETSKTSQLAPGVHKFPFCYRLPGNLPTSIKSEFGRIEYKIILTVVNPLAINTVFIKQFKVEYPLDLNSNALCKEPITHLSQSTSWWSLSGPQIIYLKLETKTTGFTIGEPLYFQLIVENNSRFECCNILVRLRQLVHHIADGEVNTVRTTIAAKSLGSMPKMSAEKYDDTIDIPRNIVPSSTDTSSCDILQVGYKIQIIVRTPRFHEDFVSCVPIFLGAVPIGGNLIDIVNVLDTKL